LVVVLVDLMMRLACQGVLVVVVVVVATMATVLVLLDKVIEVARDA
jgi:hypothetical protein